MGANAIWLADHLFAGKKVVIWAHTVHLARGFQRTPTKLQAGEVMHRHWGSGYKVAQFSSAGGMIFEYVSGKPTAVPTPAAGSLEEGAAHGVQPCVTDSEFRALLLKPQFGDTAV